MRIEVGRSRKIIITANQHLQLIYTAFQTSDTYCIKTIVHERTIERELMMLSIVAISNRRHCRFEPSRMYWCCAQKAERGVFCNAIKLFSQMKRRLLISGCWWCWWYHPLIDAHKIPTIHRSHLMLDIDQTTSTYTHQLGYWMRT